MDDYLDDHDQAEALKRWWQKYGKAIITGIVLGLVALFGTRSWYEHRAAQEQAASLIYAQFSQALSADENKRALRSGQELIEQYDNTVYAMLAGFGLARIQVDAGDLKGAEARLRWVLDHADQPGLVHIARLRLARVLLADKQPDAALAVINKGKAGAFGAAYQDVSGDIYQAKGMSLQAREAYRQALAMMAPDAPTRRLVQVKLDNLATVDAGTAASSAPAAMPSAMTASPVAPSVSATGSHPHGGGK